MSTQKTVVLARDLHFFRLQIHDRMVAAVMAEF